MSKADRLLTLSNPNGVDLTTVAGAASETHGLGRRRARTEEEIKEGLPHWGLQDTVTGTQSRDYRRRTNSIEEVAAAAGPRRVSADKIERLDDWAWLAARLKIAGDKSAFWEVWRCLRIYAVQTADKQRWPAQVEGLAPRDAKGKPIPGQSAELIFYIEPLAALVVRADAEPDRFTRIPGAHALHMRVEPEIWDRVLEPKYQALCMKYELLVNSALSWMNRCIVEGNEEREEPTKPGSRKSRGGR